MQKIIFIFLVIIVLSSFSLVALADEYDRDEAFVSWKLVAYAIYPAGFIVENVVIKPGHWLISLPFLKDISGHAELSKGLVEEQINNKEWLKTRAEEIQEFEDIKAALQEIRNTSDKVEESVTKAKGFVSKAETTAVKAENAASFAEDAAEKAEEALKRSETAAEKAETIFNKMLPK